jgi:hypothetical protein
VRSWLDCGFVWFLGECVVGWLVSLLVGWLVSWLAGWLVK